MCRIALSNEFNSLLLDDKGDTLEVLSDYNSFKPYPIFVFKDKQQIEELIQFLSDCLDKDK